MHVVLKNQLLEMERLGHKIRYVLNSDVDGSIPENVRDATIRNRKQKYWNYDEETKLYSLKPEYAKHINKKTFDFRDKAVNYP
jgi:hypothetical protein